MTPQTPVLESGCFRDRETVFAKNQPEYIPLPTLLSSRGLVTSRWALSFKERVRVLFGASIYLQTMTFNHPLQPIRISLDEPDPRLSERDAVTETLPPPKAA